MRGIFTKLFMHLPPLSLNPVYLLHTNHKLMFNEPSNFSLTMRQTRVCHILDTQRLHTENPDKVSSPLQGSVRVVM